MKPLVGIMLLGVVAFSQIYRKDPDDAVVLTGMLVLPGHRRAGSAATR